ncbi:MAG: radical SAM protein [Alphaproteobacteria bacterium]|nr:radical SAM protein [Alphaproteobacteria bacterium]
MQALAEEQPWIGPDGQVMRRLELHLTYTCPERCVFCSEDHRMTAYKRFPVTWGRVATVLRTHAARGVRHLHLTGGEPSIHPRFIDVLTLAKRLGMRTSIGSIGTMLRRPAFAAQAMPLLDEGLFSLHGPSAEVHDALTRRAGSFDQVTEALSRAQELNPDFLPCVNSVLVRPNAEHLPETIALADRLGARLIVVSNLTPEGAGLDNYEELAVPLEQLRALVPRAVPAAKRAILRFFGVPYCLLGEHGPLSNDLHWDPRVTVEWTAKPGKVVFDDHWSWDPGRKRLYAPECGGCRMQGVCMGVFDRYAELWPTQALTPVLPDSPEGAAP